MRLLLALLALAATLSAAPSYNSDAVTFTDAAPATAVLGHSFTQATASGNMLFVAVLYEQAVNWSVSYNGVGMSVVRRGDSVAGNVFTDVFFLASPATGANMVSFTAAAGYSTGPVSTVVWSYNGTNGSIGTTNASTGSPTGSPFPINVTITPGAATSLVLALENAGVGICSNSPSYTQSAGTAQFTAPIFSQNNKHYVGVGDWAANSTSNVNLSLTMTSGCSSSGSIVGTLWEVQAAASAAGSTGTAGAKMMMGVGQ